jgi:nicotinamidase-related amidase
VQSHPLSDVNRQRIDAFRRAGLNGPARRGSRPAIVVVDLQIGFTDRDRPLGADCAGVIAAVNGLLTAGHAVDIPVVFTVIGFDPDAWLPWFDKMPQLTTLALGSDNCDLDDRLLRADGDAVVTKQAPSALFGTGVAELLRDRDVDTVIVAGVTTSGCVRATVVDALSCGFTVLVPADAVGDRATGPHDAALIDIAAKYGDVIDLATAAQYLQSLTVGHRS